MYCMYLLSFVALPRIHSTCRRNVLTSSCLSFIIINHWLLSSHSFSLHSTRTCYVSCVLAMWHYDTMYYYIITVPYNCSRSNIVVDGTTNIDTTLEEVWLHRTRSVNCFSSPSPLLRQIVSAPLVPLSYQRMYWELPRVRTRTNSTPMKEREGQNWFCFCVESIRNLFYLRKRKYESIHMRSCCCSCHHVAWHVQRQLTTLRPKSVGVEWYGWAHVQP